MFYSFRLLIITAFFLATGVAGAYPVNPFVDRETWAALSPYFLPEDHPAKERLDRIFSKSKVMADKKGLKKGGFRICRTGKGTYAHPNVVSHSQLQGYLLKLYLDDSSLQSYAYKFVDRVVGAEAVREAIRDHEFESILKVPKKWIYPLPTFLARKVKKKGYRKDFVLVVEDMDIYGWKENLKMWKGEAMTPELLEAVVTILEEVGLDDSVYPCNIPFSKDGRVCFLDTEHYHSWPVGSRQLKCYLSEKLSEHLMNFLPNLIEDLLSPDPYWHCSTRPVWEGAPD